MSRSIASRSLLVLFLLLCAAPPAGAVAPVLWTMQTLEEFERGKPDGVAVGSGGDLVLTPALRLLNVPALDQSTEPFLWSQAVDGKGNLYVGGGRSGGIPPDPLPPLRKMPCGHFGLSPTVILTPETTKPQRVKESTASGSLKSAAFM